ncbi:MAG: hypothetical protein AAF481_16420 [Acidobacteriota bacterium]
MDASIVFRKTGKGIAEIDRDERRLGTQARQLLILIDGNRTVGDLGLLMPSLGDVRPTLRDLLFEGLVTTSSPEAMESPEYPELPGLPSSSSRPAVAQPRVPDPKVDTLSPPPSRTEALAGGTLPTGIEPSVLPAVEGAAAVSEPEPPPMPESPPPAADPSAARFAEMKGLFLREVRDLFLRDADLIAPKVKACQSVTELSLLATKLRGIAESYADSDTADRFLTRVMSILSDGN